MTHILVSGVLLNLAALAFAFLPVVARRAGSKAGQYQRYAFGALVMLLWLFSMNETITENGVTYGLAFSLIPVLAGCVVLFNMKAR